jgi:hypothetical protein
MSVPYPVYIGPGGGKYTYVERPGGGGPPQKVYLSRMSPSDRKSYLAHIPELKSTTIRYSQNKLFLPELNAVDVTIFHSQYPHDPFSTAKELNHSHQNSRILAHAPPVGKGNVVPADHNVPNSSFISKIEIRVIKPLSSHSQTIYNGRPIQPEPPERVSHAPALKNAASIAIKGGIEDAKSKVLDDVINFAFSSEREFSAESLRHDLQEKFGNAKYAQEVGKEIATGTLNASVNKIASKVLSTAASVHAAVTSPTEANVRSALDAAVGSVGSAGLLLYSTGTCTMESTLFSGEESDGKNWHQKRHGVTVSGGGPKYVEILSPKLGVAKQELSYTAPDGRTTDQLSTVNATGSFGSSMEVSVGAGLRTRTTAGVHLETRGALCDTRTEVRRDAASGAVAAVTETTGHSNASVVHTVVSTDKAAVTVGQRRISDRMVVHSEEILPVSVFSSTDTAVTADGSALLETTVHETLQSAHFTGERASQEVLMSQTTTTKGVKVFGVGIKTGKSDVQNGTYNRHAKVSMRSDSSGKQNQQQGLQQQVSSSKSVDLGGGKTMSAASLEYREQGNFEKSFKTDRFGYGQQRLKSSQESGVYVGTATAQIQDVGANTNTSLSIEERGSSVRSFTAGSGKGKSGSGNVAGSRSPDSVTITESQRALRGKYITTDHRQETTVTTGVTRGGGTYCHSSSLTAADKVQTRQITTHGSAALGGESSTKQTVSTTAGDYHSTVLTTAMAQQGTRSAAQSTSRVENGQFSTSTTFAAEHKSEGLRSILPNGVANGKLESVGLTSAAKSYKGALIANSGAVSGSASASNAPKVEAVSRTDGGNFSQAQVTSGKIMLFLYYKVYIIVRCGAWIKIFYGAFVLVWCFFFLFKFQHTTAKRTREHTKWRTPLADFKALLQMGRWTYIRKTASIPLWRTSPARGQRKLATSKVMLAATR